MTTKKRGLASNPLFEKTDQQGIAGTSSSTEAETTAQTGLETQHGRAESGDESIAMAAAEPNEPQTDSRRDQQGALPPDQPGEQSTDSLGTDASSRSSDVSTNQLINPSTNQVMRRPAAFYLYEDQNDELDDLIGRLRKEYKIKTDRSALLRAVLTRPVLDYHDESNHRKLIERLLLQATSRLMRR